MLNTMLKPDKPRDGQKREWIIWLIIWLALSSFAALGAYAVTRIWIDSL